MHHYPALSEFLGCEAYVKHENHQSIEAFKVRGGINLVAGLSEEERCRRVITASTGNLGQPIAYVARLFGVRAIAAMPEETNPDKVRAMRHLGAEVIFHARTSTKRGSTWSCWRRRKGTATSTPLRCARS